MRKQLPLLAISAVLALVMLAAGVSYWWVWLVCAVVVGCQIGVGLGWPEKFAPKPPVRRDICDRSTPTGLPYSSWTGSARLRSMLGVLSRPARSRSTRGGRPAGQIC